jgi:hypothetical protein
MKPGMIIQIEKEIILLPKWISQPGLNQLGHMEPELGYSSPGFPFCGGVGEEVNGAGVPFLGTVPIRPANIHSACASFVYIVFESGNVLTTVQGFLKIMRG